jgi:hypothetical protein
VEEASCRSRPEDILNYWHKGGRKERVEEASRRAGWIWCRAATTLNRRRDGRQQTGIFTLTAVDGGEYPNWEPRLQSRNVFIGVIRALQHRGKRNPGLAEKEVFCPLWFWHLEGQYFVVNTHALHVYIPMWGF